MVEKVENPSSAPDFVSSPELVEGIISGRITTFTIWKENIPYCLEAASKTNFEVTVIAQPGQHYITEESKPVSRVTSYRRLRTNGQSNTPTITAVKSQDTVREGYVGISLKRPEGVTTDTTFYSALQKIQPR